MLVPAYRTAELYKEPLYYQSYYNAVAIILTVRRGRGLQPTQQPPLGPLWTAGALGLGEFSYPRGFICREPAKENRLEGPKLIFMGMLHGIEH